MGMAEKARILKTSLTSMFSLIEKQNVLLVLLNQVMAEIGGWRPGETSSGGNALKHDVHMRIKIDGGKTEYDGVYAVEKYSTLSLEKSKISPLMGNIPIIIDITKGGVINRAKSLMLWMTQVNPIIFKSGSWWSIEEWAYNKYKPYWDKFEGLYPKFRQTKLYETAQTNENFVDFLQLIWLDFISGKYKLQGEICKKLRSEIETRLMINLGISYEEFNPVIEESTPSVTSEDLSTLSDVLGMTVNTDTGEILSD